MQSFRLTNWLNPRKSVIARILSSDEKEVSLRSLTKSEKLELPFLFEKGYIVFTEIEDGGSIPFSFNYEGKTYSLSLKANTKITVTEVGEIFFK